MGLTIKITREQARKVLNNIPPNASITLKASDAEKILGKKKTK